MTTKSKTTKIKFLYSYAGKILPRQIDGKLRYVGGFTRVLSVDRSLTFSDLVRKFRESCGSAMNVRCKLPSEDLDVLISVTSDEDLASVIEEYDRVSLCMNQDLKIRAILFPVKLLKQASSGLQTVSSVNSEDSSCSSKSPPTKVAGVCESGVCESKQVSSNLQYSSRISSQAKLLKQASPVLQTVSSVNSVNSSCSSKSPPRKVAGVCFAHQQVSSNLKYSCRIPSQAGKYTVRFENDGRTVRFHHCREQGRHMNSYFIPYSKLQ